MWTLWDLACQPRDTPKVSHFHFFSDKFNPLYFSENISEFDKSPQESEKMTLRSLRSDESLNWMFLNVDGAEKPDCTYIPHCHFLCLPFNSFLIRNSLRHFSAAPSLSPQTPSLSLRNRLQFPPPSRLLISFSPFLLSLSFSHNSFSSFLYSLFLFFPTLKWVWFGVVVVNEVLHITVKITDSLTKVRSFWIRFPWLFLWKYPSEKNDRPPRRWATRWNNEGGCEWECM